MANTDKVSNTISWYRIPLKGESLRGLSQRSDWKGLLQACGHLGLLVLTGAAAFYANGRFPLPMLLLIIFLHGTFYKFILNGFHELCHSSVFKTKALNNFFLHVFSFLGWYSPVMFWTSHSEHHKYTLHQPDDLEVVMPIKYTLMAFLKSAFVNPIQFFISLETNIRFSFGKISKKDMPGEWEVDDLFPPSEVENRRRLFNWARTLLVGHGLIIGISIYTGLWLLPVLITFGRFYGGWLLFFCNNCQHVGLQDKVPDFRLCCWTVILNPFVQFLYWHMNYHIEHHMYAAVPCYNLGRLHRAIEYDLPESPNGLYAVWNKIAETLKKQKADPDYHYVPELPEIQFRVPQSRNDIFQA